MQFIATQRDLITFIPLFAFITAAVECVVLSREESRQRRWLSFFGFFLIQGLAFLWTLLSAVVPPLAGWAMLALLLNALSFGALFSFASPPDAGRRRKHLTVVVSLLLIAASMGARAWWGAAWGDALCLLLVIVPGTAFAVSFLLGDPAVRAPGRPWLVTYAVTLGCFALVMTAGVVSDLLFHSRGKDAVLVAQAAVSLGLAVSLSMHEWRTFARENRGYGRLMTRIVVYAAILSLPILLFLGGFLTVALGSPAIAELGRENADDIEILRAAIEAQTGEIDRDVTILSGSPRIAPFVGGESVARRSQVEELLNRYSHALKSDCYILNTRGETVASSSGAPASFTRISHAGMRWFRTGLGGANGRDFGVDLATYVRNYYSSAPVWDLEKGIIGVAVVVKDVESIFHAVNRADDAFLIDEDGIILFTTRNELLYHVLWPLPPVATGAAFSLRDLGFISFAPVFPAKPAGGDSGPWRGSFSLVTRSFLSVPGWSVVYLGSEAGVLLYRLAGLLATLVLALVIAMFSAAGQLSLLGEARTRRSESLYRALVEGTPDWISIVDPAGTFLFTNKAGRESLGIAAGQIETLLGERNMAHLVGMIEVALRGSVVSFEIPLPSADGEVKAWRLTLVPLQREGLPDAAILIGNDVSEARRAEARLVRVERMAALGTLAAGVAHQFNNINAVALGYLQVLESEKSMSASARGYLRSVEEALQRSVEITTRLLPLSIPSGGVAVSTDPCAVVRAIAISLEQDLGRDKVSIDLALEEVPPVAVNGEQLAFVVHALLVNAWHAVLDQPLRRVSVRVASQDGQVMLRVTDTGIGIAAESKSSLFTPFFSEKGEHAPHDSPQARVKGVGLSLAVAHSIVTGNEGRIEVESAPGAGSTFTVLLPCVPGQE
jgi:PAS domain S-box-containing protein